MQLGDQGAFGVNEATLMVGRTTNSDEDCIPARITLKTKGNVVIESADGSKIKSSQIYWDPEQEWLFTEEDIVFSSNEYDINANKLDADRSFKLLKTGQLNGNFLFDDN